MFSAKQLKIKVVSEDGGHLFQVGKPPAGLLTLKTPGRLPLNCLLLTMQDQTITVAENSTILKSGEKVYPFAFDLPLKPEGHFESALYDDVLTVKVYPNFRSFNTGLDVAKKAFKASHYSFHQLKQWFQVSVWSGLALLTTRISSSDNL